MLIEMCSFFWIFYIVVCMMLMWEVDRMMYFFKLLRKLRVLCFGVLYFKSNLEFDLYCLVVKIF